MEYKFTVKAIDTSTLNEQLEAGGIPIQGVAKRSRLLVDGKLIKVDPYIIVKAEKLTSDQLITVERILNTHTPPVVVPPPAWETLTTDEKIATLEAKLADDSLSFEEMKELMRLKG